MIESTFIHIDTKDPCLDGAIAPDANMMAARSSSPSECLGSGYKIACCVRQKSYRMEGSNLPIIPYLSYTIDSSFP